MSPRIPTLGQFQQGMGKVVFRAEDFYSGVFPPQAPDNERVPIRRFDVPDCINI